MCCVCIRHWLVVECVCLGTVHLQVQELEQADREGLERDTQEQLQDLVSR